LTGDAQTFHAPALVAQALMAVFSVSAFLGVVALYLDVFFGLSVLSWQVSGSVIVLSAAGLAACFWWVGRPRPVLIVGESGLDWRLSVAEPLRLGWDRVAAYALYTPEELARIGHAPPPEKRGERCLAVYPRGQAGFLAAYEEDVTPGLDKALAALRRWRPDLERGA